MDDAPIPEQVLLDAAVLDVQRAEARLSPLLAELSTATRQGNADRIAAAALEAQHLGDALAGALSRVFSRAAALSAQQFDTATPVP